LRYRNNLIVHLSVIFITTAYHLICCTDASVRQLSKYLVK